MTPKEDEKSEEEKLKNKNEEKEKIEEEELIECGRLSCSNSVSDIFFDCSDKFNEREEDQQRENRTTLVTFLN